MRRIAAVAGLLLLVLTPVWVLSQGWPSGSLPIVTGDGRYLHADHAGALYVSQRPVSFGAAEWVVQVSHITTQVHVANMGILNALAVRCVNPGATAFADCGGAGGSADAVNVFHQSTVRHVSSVTHVFGFVRIVNVAGANATLTGSSLDVNVTNTAAVSQSGEWNVRHVSGAMHIAGVHGSGALRAWRVASCGTAASSVIATNTARREIWLTNMGTSNIYIGYGVTGHVALTTSNGWPMHAASASTGLAYPMKFRNYYGPLSCITDNGSQQLGVMEILRN